MALSPEAMTEVVRYASVESFQSAAVVPLALLPVFGVIWVYDSQAKLALEEAST